MHIAVIGGGVIGTTTAYWLARDGHTVTLLERGTELAAEASFANGGMLHASHGEPWNSPQAIRQLLAWIGREDSPLLLRPTQVPRMLGWGLAFLRNSASERHRRATLANTRLARYSLGLMDALAADLGGDYDAADSGIAKIFWSQRELDASVRSSDLLQEIGVPYRSWTTEQLIDHEPALAPNRAKLAGALYYPQDATGDAHLFTRLLGERCRALGVTVRTGTTVRALQRSGTRITGLLTESGALEADAVVLAAGPEAPRLTRPLGLQLPIEPVKGYSITLDADKFEQRPRLPLIDDRHKIVATPLGQRLRVAGTAEFGGYDTSVNPKRIALLLRQLAALLPQRETALDALPRSDWACLRAMTPDGVPIIGRSPVDRLWLNVGAGHMGWTLAAGMGRLLADMIAERPLALDQEAYRHDRPSL